MILECIDGPNKGDHCVIPDIYKVDDHWRMREKPKYKVFDRFPMTNEETAKVATEKIHHYIILEEGRGKFLKWIPS